MYLVSGSYDNTVKVWIAKNLTLLAILKSKLHLVFELL